MTEQKSLSSIEHEIAGEKGGRLGAQWSEVTRGIG